MLNSGLLLHLTNSDIVSIFIYLPVGMHYVENMN